jgi:hypothetical protein
MVSEADRSYSQGELERRWISRHHRAFLKTKRQPMARQTKSMRQIKEILRLKFQHQLSIREIARSCALPTSTVGDYLKRAELAGLSWPIPEEWTEEQILERLLGVPDPSPEVPQALPDWAQIHEELRRKSVTLRLLWQEYRHSHPEGYGYSRFCELYDRWAQRLDPVLRQVHRPGEKMFVDWAGQTVPIYKLGRWNGRSSFSVCGRAGGQQ